MSRPKLVGASRTAICSPGRSHARGVANASSRPRAAPLARTRLVHEHEPQDLEERRVARRVRRQEHRAVVLVAQRRERRRLAGDVRPARHAGGELPVEAEHELVGPVVVREEPREVQAVHLVGARPRDASASVERERAGADEAEQARAVRAQVAEHAARPRAVRREDPRRERVRHDEVPVAARPRRRQPPVRPLAVAEPDRHEQRPVAQPPRRPLRGAAQSRRRASTRRVAPSRRAHGDPVASQTAAISRSPCHATACEWRP